MTVVEATRTPLAPAPLGDGGLAALVELKRDRRVAVCIPARDEAATVGGIVGVVARLRRAGLVDDLVVVDDGSADDTAAAARRAGARVVRSTRGPGKGQALTRAVAATDADLLVFLDADVSRFQPQFVTHLVAPLLAADSIELVKPSYRRPLGDAPDGGGRVTELLARPLLRRFFPEIAALSQPLAGECAVRRRTLDDLVLADGYGIEIGLLIDVVERHGLGAVAEVDLGERVHRNRPLHQLRPHTDDVLGAVLDRIARPGHGDTGDLP